jgi:hypothetical protein
MEVTDGLKAQSNNNNNNNTMLLPPSAIIFIKVLKTFPKHPLQNL